MANQVESKKLLFSIAVAEFFQQARLFHNMLTEDLAAFEAFNTMMNAAWAAEFAAKITAAEQATTPNQAAAELMGATDDVLALLKDARNSVQEVFFFVTKAWPGSKPRLVAYGKEMYGRAKQSQTKMALLMEKTLGQMAADEAELDAVGYTQAKRDAFAGLLAALEEKIAAQDRAKSRKALVTEAYYTSLNSVWLDMALISRASKIVFMDNYPKWKAYMLHRYRKKKKKEEVAIETLPSVEQLPEQALNPGLKAEQGQGSISVA